MTRSNRSPRGGPSPTGAARIAVDLLGGDDAPAVVVDGVRVALHADPDLSVLLAGPDRLLAETVATLGDPLRCRVRPLPAEQRVGMADAPVRAVRARPGATVRVAIEAVQAGLADAVVTAGSTGAVVAAAMQSIGMLPEVRRPTLAVVVPAVAHPLVLLDVGATVDATDRDLRTNALLGAAYASVAFGLPAPRVGLLSVGTERGKGDLRRRRADRLLSEWPGLNYVGLVEGHHVPLGGPADVVVTDGFTGNVLLKGIEGTLGAMGGRGEQGWAPAPRAATLLGVPATVVIGHGAAGAGDIADCLAAAALAVRFGQSAGMAAAFASISGAGERGEPGRHETPGEPGAIGGPAEARGYGEPGERGDHRGLGRPASPSASDPAVGHAQGVGKVQR